ncbi:MAG TPA: TetR family transcriptional regulator [Vicinamibacterales bacterium]|nr:TetR family transcriptional regulator [Vicinamibacterales bacterium]
MTRAAGAESRKAQQSAATRAELLSQSLLVFAKRGVSHTALDDVARAAGVTKGAIYWHFRNKDDLFQAILDDIRSRWQEAVLTPVSSVRDPRARLECFFDGYAKLFTDTPEICLFLQHTLLDTQNKRCFGKVTKVFGQTRVFVERILNDGKHAGCFHQSLNPKITALAIIGSLAGATQQCLVDRNLKIKDAIDEVRAMTLARVGA